MKLLFVSPYPPTPLRRRPFELIRQLVERGHDLTLVTYGGRPGSENALLDTAPGVAKLIEWPARRMRRIVSMAGASARGEPLQSRFDWSPGFARRLDDELAESAFDLIHVEHLRGAIYGRALRHRAPVVWDSVDCISDLFESAARMGVRRRHRLAARIELGRTRRLEARLPLDFEETVVTAEHDRLGLLRLFEAHGLKADTPARQPRITVIPNGVDLVRFAPPPRDRPRDPETILLSGKLSFHANVAAALDLVRSIMPRVWPQRPSAKVVLAGADPPPEVRALAARDPRVTVTGYVDDLRPYLIRATLAVVPLRYGVGIQNKALEAMACATPVVLSPGAASALRAEDSVEMLVGDDIEAMAARIIEVLDSPKRAAAIGDAGRRYVEREHGWARTAQAFEAVYERAVETRAMDRT